MLKRKRENANVESVEWELSSPREAGAGIRNRGCLTRYCVRDGVARPWTPSINPLGPDPRAMVDGAGASAASAGSAVRYCVCAWRAVDAKPEICVRDKRMTG